MADGLLAIAERVVAQARDGEQVEAYVARTRDTDVKVFDGEVESLSSAQTEGVGVRVVNDNRQGFAYAGSLEDDAVADALAEARDNAGFGSEDEFLGLPEPDGVTPADLDLFRSDLANVAADDKVALALEVERATRAADSRIRGVETAEYGDAAVEAAVASSTGVRAHVRRTVCSVYAFALAGEGAETQTGYGYDVGRHPDELDVAKASSMAAERATQMLGAKQPASRKITVVLDPLVTASFLGVLSSALSGIRSARTHRRSDNSSRPAIPSPRRCPRRKRLCSRSAICRPASPTRSSSGRGTTIAPASWPRWSAN